MTKLKDITGKALSGEWGTDDETGVGIPVLRTTNFTNEGIVNYENVVTRIITKKDISEKYLQSGDIIIEKSGGSDKQPVGRVIYFDGPENTYLFNNFTGLLRVRDKNEWFPRYVFYSLFANYKKGGTRPFENKTTGLHNLKTDDYVSRYEITEIPVNKQIAICSQLDQILKVINLRRKELSNLDDLIKARFIELFGDADRFEAAPLDDNVEEMFIGPFGSSLKNECFVAADQGYCMVYEQKHAIKKTMEVDTRYIDEKKYKELRRFTVQGGDIIVSCRGTIGETFIIPDGAPFGIMHPSIMKIRLKAPAYNRVFFNHLLQTVLERHEAEANGSGVKMAITATALGKEHFILPPMELQEQFAAFVEQTDKSKATVQKALDETQLLFDSLMQQYFG